MLAASSASQMIAKALPHGCYTKARSNLAVMAGLCIVLKLFGILVSALGLEPRAP
jgi:hypothetical protein